MVYHILSDLHVVGPDPWGQTCILKPNPWKALLTKPKSWDTVRVKDCENYLAY